MVSERRMRLTVFVGLCTFLLGACDGPAAPETVDVATESRGPPGPRPDHETVVRVDAESGEILAVLPTHPFPGLLVVAAGHIWTMNFGDGTLTHVDPSTDTASTLDVGEVAGIASDGQDLWVARDRNVVAKLDGPTGEEVAAFSLADRDLFRLGDAGFVGVGGGSLWLTVPGSVGHPEELWRIDPSDGDVLARIPIGGDANSPFAHGRYLWVVTKDDQALTRVDMRANAAVEFDVESFPWSLTAGGGALWIGHHVNPKVKRFDAVTLEETAELQFDTNPRGLAFGGGVIWVATEDGLYAVDPASSQVTRIVEFGPFPFDTGPIGVAFLDGSVWVSIE